MTDSRRREHLAPSVRGQPRRRPAVAARRPESAQEGEALCPGHYEPGAFSSAHSVFFWVGVASNVSTRLDRKMAA